MATSSKNTGTAKATAAKPAATKAPAKAAPKPAAKPAGAKPKYTKVKVLVNGKVTSVLMEQGKANALAVKRAKAKGAAGAAATTAANQALIPKQYADYVDANAVAGSVDAQIAAGIAPLQEAAKQAQVQFDSNVAASNSLNGQTQASLDQLIQNANARTQAFQNLAGQGIAATAKTNTDAASAVAHALGGAMNPNVAALVDQGSAVKVAQQHAAGVNDVWANTLSSGAQRDFFERGKGISSITQQAFNDGQRKALAQALSGITAQTVAAKQQRAALIAAEAEKEAQFGLSAQTAAAAFETDQQKLAQTDYANETDRIAAEKRAAAAGTAAGDKAEAARIKAVAAATAEQKKAAAKVKAEVLKMVQLTRVPTVTKVNKDGSVTKVVRTNAEVFGKGSGPWRYAFDQLLDPAGAGMSAANAALYATLWFKGSITSSTPTNIKKMLSDRDVPEQVQKSIITQAFGANGWKSAQGQTADQIKANDPTRTSGTYMPVRNMTEWANGIVSQLKGKKFSPGAYGDFTLQRYADGNWWFKGSRGNTFTAKATSGEAPIRALLAVLKANPKLGR